MEPIRLQKFLADSGIASRRKCEELITIGAIEVNGQTVTELGTKVNPEIDEVKYSGKLDDILKHDNVLTKLGIDIPIMMDMSLKLQFYDLSATFIILLLNRQCG